MADLFPLKHGINDWSETPLMMLPMVIQLIDNDDDRAWMTSLYEKECRVMFRTARAYTNQQADAEDIVSESCVHLIEHLDTIRGMESKKLSMYIVHTVKCSIRLCDNAPSEGAFCYVRGAKFVQSGIAVF